MFGTVLERVWDPVSILDTILERYGWILGGILEDFGRILEAFWKDFWNVQNMIRATNGPSIDR